MEENVRKSSLLQQRAAEIHSSATALGQFLYAAQSAQMGRASRWKWFSTARTGFSKLRESLKITSNVENFVILNKETSNYPRTRHLTWIGRRNFKLRLIT